MKIKTDFSEAHFKPINGLVVVEILSCDLKNEEKNRPLLKWKMSILEPKCFFQRIIYRNTVVQGAGSEYLFRFLKAIDKNINPNEFDTNEVIGKKVCLQVRSNLDDGPGYYPEILSVSPYLDVNDNKESKDLSNV